jgi:tetratricopeptide (TPR) repeat protein
LPVCKFKKTYVYITDDSFIRLYGDAGEVKGDDLLDNILTLEKIKELKESGQHKDAIPLLVSYLENDPNDLECLNLLTHCLLINGELTKAKAVLTRARKLSLSSAAVEWNEVRFLLISGHTTEALRLATLTNKNFPDDVEGMVVLGACLRETNDIKRSLFHLDEALKRDPKHADALTHKALIEIRNNNEAKAIVYLAAAHKSKPYNKKIWGLLINLHFGVKEYSSGVSLLLNMIKIDPRYENMIELFDACTSKASYTPELFQDLNELMSSEHPEPLIYLYIGIASNNWGKKDDAVKAFEKLISVSPEEARAYNYLGLAIQPNADPQKAINYFKQAIRINPKYVNAYFNLGVLLTKLGRFGPAIDAYNKVLLTDESNIAALISLGNLYKEQGNPQKAIDAYQKVVALRPSYSEGFYKIGAMLYEARAYDQAAKMFGKDLSIKSQLELMKCYYENNLQNDLLNQIDFLLQKGIRTAVLGSYISRAQKKFGIVRDNPFCSDPLNHVLTVDLIETCDFSNIFIRRALEILGSNTVENRFQSLLTNGTQTSGDIFNQFGDLAKTIKQIIISEVENYRTTFKNSDEGFIKNWPSQYDIKGWLICMKNGGELAPHMHDQGWISGSIYINVPPKVRGDSGNLVVCLNDMDLNRNNMDNTRVINVETGSLCLFPSSLLHYTLPFESEQERIVLAFDIVEI